MAKPLLQRSSSGLLLDCEKIFLMAGFETSPLTPEHYNFHREIGEIAFNHTAQTVKQLLALFEPPCSDPLRTGVAFSATIDQTFVHPDNPKGSRFFPGDIAGSDRFAFRESELAEELWNLPSDQEIIGHRFSPWIINLTLRYDHGDRSTPADMALVMNTDMTPLLINHEAYKEMASPSMVAIWTALRSVGANQIYQPNADELRLIRHAFGEAGEDIDLGAHLRHLLEYEKDRKAQAAIRAALQNLEERRGRQ